MSCWPTTTTSEIYTLSLHDALPISADEGFTRPVCRYVVVAAGGAVGAAGAAAPRGAGRSEEHTSELQSHSDLVCRPLLEKKNDDARKEEAVRAAGDAEAWTHRVAAG